MTDARRADHEGIIPISRPNVSEADADNSLVEHHRKRQINLAEMFRGGGAVQLDSATRLVPNRLGS